MAGTPYRDTYADFALRYDRFFGTFDQHDPIRAEFFRELFTAHEVQTVLDCACGTGRDLHLFHTLGFEVSGSDISPAMLAQARKNLTALGVDISLRQVDFRELPEHYGKQFDAVACLSTSLPHFLKEEEIIAALTNMHAVLRDGGILVLSQAMCDKQLHNRPHFTPVINSRDFSRIFVTEYYTETLHIDILDILHGDGEEDFQVCGIDYRILVQDDYERLLAQVGFAEVIFYGTFNFEPYDKVQSDRLIVVAVK